MSQVDAEVRKLPVSKVAAVEELARVALHSQLEVSKAETAAEEQRTLCLFAALQRFAEESEALVPVEAALAKGRQLPTPATVAAPARRMGEDDEVQSYEWLRMSREDDCRQAGLGLCFVDNFEARRRLARLLTARASRRTPFQDRLFPHSVVCYPRREENLWAQGARKAGSYRILFEEFREIVELIEELHVSSQRRSRHELNARRTQPRQCALPGTESRKLRPFEAALFDRCHGGRGLKQSEVAVVESSWIVCLYVAL
ncbi:unc-89 [Symbiodinium sp. CCMP2592]|nr:unc-89 [Symbiodinium sp. CCMP2592]